MDKDACVPVKKGQVDIEMNHLSDRISDLEEVLNILEKRLSLVFLPINEEDSSLKEPSSVNCPLAEGIRDQRIRITRIVNRVNYQLKGLQI